MADATCPAPLDRSPSARDRDWICEAISKVEADFNRSADTHLIKLELPCLEGIDLYLKDESTHPSGSLKHRLARSLFLYGLCNGWITRGTPIIEASSGSTAISEAYFARLLGLPFIAVVPDTTASRKIAQIEFQGGECRRVPARDIYDEAARLRDGLGGHYVDQFTYAERATDWRGNNNIAESIFSQMERERFPVPAWVVVSAGTGGTSSTIGRYIRYRPRLFASTRLCVVDPENSVFFDFFRTGNRALTSDRGSRIEGIGRPRVEPSFMPEVIDRMMRAPDAASIGTLWWLESVLGRKCGGSTGTNLFASLQLAEEMARHGRSGSIVTMICDSGERYLDSYFDPDWVQAQGLDVAPWVETLDRFARSGALTGPAAVARPEPLAPRDHRQGPLPSS
ncbi:PLP-dependent cysteine synthase family protein [Albimonas sp. CAU 1670]|uniref:PLP-dependent cysteine synthase family protein n=1 Tax=Albimonas sp. CAU 1670 TaxID=3032599 RepID=UPI0023DA0B2E|nr:PLP-dependent cysteine synthase family protein [Albimonas sp. CAU 1670]MDF2235904.1 PLP-dependent cysteine synthase family protein [Albimonas sp. CAU 1670]